MSKISQDQIVGIDVSRDWLDIHCLPDGAKLRFPNNYDGHMRVAALAEERHALVCFEATGGQEWRLWSNLDTAGIERDAATAAHIHRLTAKRSIRLTSTRRRPKWQRHKRSGDLLIKRPKSVQTN